MSKFISAIGEMPQGGIQNLLESVAKKAPEGYGGPTAKSVKNVSDHAAGITFALRSLDFIGPVENAMPTFGFRTTKMAREGRVQGVDLDTLKPFNMPQQLDPLKADASKHLKN